MGELTVRLIARPSPTTPLLPLHTLPVPAKSSETRAILLLILGHTEHLWIQIKIVFVKARMPSKKEIGSNCYEANFLCYNDPL